MHSIALLFKVLYNLAVVHTNAQTHAYTRTQTPMVGCYQTKQWPNYQEQLGFSVLL